MADWYLGVGVVAERCDVSRSTVHHWMLKYGASGDGTFPEPPVKIATTAAVGDQAVPARTHYGWTFEQVEEIVARFGRRKAGAA